MELNADTTTLDTARAARKAEQAVQDKARMELEKVLRGVVETVNLTTVDELRVSLSCHYVEIINALKKYLPSGEVGHLDFVHNNYFIAYGRASSSIDIVFYAPAQQPLTKEVLGLVFISYTGTFNKYELVPAAMYANSRTLYASGASPHINGFLSTVWVSVARRLMRKLVHEPLGETKED